ncbi:hypothetical protein [Burkholderia multivorans]|uniref:hypothetical protein n=1 Tax=Burkholderia multivorans TaxID=87883 RepID=UPI00075392CA|nr:hypothetical protein [Burkholderia multivorans]KVT39600.1 hypothetical protein WK52_27665 [Burkholderia multivorans]
MGNGEFVRGNRGGADGARCRPAAETYRMILRLRTAGDAIGKIGDRRRDAGLLDESTPKRFHTGSPESGRHAALA